MSSGGRGHDGTSCRWMACYQESELQSRKLGVDSWCRTGQARLYFTVVISPLMILLGRHSPFRGFEVNNSIPFMSFLDYQC